MTISTRQQSLLKAIIREYIDSAKPVASNQLVVRDNFEVSPATIRNDMAALTEAGFLQQPHTSAGRIPTEKAWRWYIDQEVDQPLSKREQAILRSVVTEHSNHQDDLLRRLARAMAAMVDESVLVARGRYDTYYTGLSNLLTQPEFAHLDLVQNLSRMVDHLDDVIGRFYDQVGEDPAVLVGKDNPFSNQCGVIIA